MGEDALYELKRLIVGELMKTVSLRQMETSGLYSEDEGKRERAAANLIKNVSKPDPGVKVDDLYMKAWMSFRSDEGSVNKAVAQLADEGILSLYNAGPSAGGMGIDTRISLRKYINTHKNPKINKYLLKDSETEHGGV